MKSLIWKEWRENVKWTALPGLLMLGPVGLFGVMPLVDEAFLVFASLVTTVYAAALGFVQIYFEASGDKRALLLHRPLSRSRIFLAKALVGIGLYLLGVSIPFAVIVGLAATPGHVPQPFEWSVVLPWLADVLTGLVFYFAGMLAAQREGRWYGSRFLGVGAGVCCWFVVWMAPELWQALLAVVLVGGIVALAAWGSFVAGGAYTPQPWFARMALACTLLLGLAALSFVGKVFIGVWSFPRSVFSYRVDHHGGILLVEEERGNVRVTDTEGRLPAELANIPLDSHAIDGITAPLARGAWPRTQSYRNSDKSFVKYSNETQPGNEWWWYVPARGVLHGYVKPSFQPIGSFGPEGFAMPGQEPKGRFAEELLHYSRLYSSWANDYLTFPSQVYKVDFRKRIVWAIFASDPGETVQWAARWENEGLKLALAFVITDRAIHVVEENGTRLASLPLTHDRDGYEVGSFGRLEDPPRYWVWYEPTWYLGLDELDRMPCELVSYDLAGRELSPRQRGAPRPGSAQNIKPRVPVIEAWAGHAWFGLLTAPAEAALLVGATRQQLAQVGANEGAQTSALLQVLVLTTQHFLPGVRWNPQAHVGLIVGFGASMVFVALACGLGCFLLARRNACSRAGTIGWALCGFCFGWMGLALMVALQEFPARISCPKCRKLRAVTRDTCEHCGARQAGPVPDGTEVFEASAGTRSAVLIEG
jgi:hypothetical protein